MEEEKKHLLTYPIPIPKEDGSVTYVKELTISRLKLKHIRRLPKALFESEGKNADMGVLIPVLPEIMASLAGIPESSAEEIDLEDLEGLTEVLTDFFENTQAKTG